MKNHNHQPTTERRDFLKKVALGATAIGVGMLPVALPMAAAAEDFSPPNTSEAEEWFKKIKGKHRMVFDVPKPHEMLPFAWPKVFLITNEKTGTPEKDCNVVVVLRHDAIPYAMDSKLWAKYNFGEVFKIEDAATKKPATRNAFWMPKPGDFQVPGIGNVQIGINELQASGVMFCVCDMAMTVYSAILADAMNMNAVDVKKEFLGGILPGIQVVPSGVWAINRAQEQGCSYCFAG